MNPTVKDFQRATAERILHIYKNVGHRRVLLADEVGLGKTFVASEVINLVRQWHRDELHDDFFKVVYICSNANIAEQNIGKLGVARRINISESRLSMQHLYITLANRENMAQLQDGQMPESIIPLTPSTSFHLTNTQGTANERALMFCILRHLPVFRAYEAALGRFLSCDVKSWPYHTAYYQGKIAECGPGYMTEMLCQLQSRLPRNLADTVIAHALHECRGRERAVAINSLRHLFAEISIDMLDPDLVIMDEFQRFSSLLQQTNDEQSMLTRRFFDDSRSNTKILLLSATPYKPYTTLEELNTEEQDEHYRDFMKVMDFLLVDEDRKAGFRLTWHRYSSALKRTDATDLTTLLRTKDLAEKALYSVMCRTERFNSGIIDDSHVTEVRVMPEDILSYAQCRHLMDSLTREHPEARLGHLPMEYVKSSPYLLSFMDRYELKKRLVHAMRQSTVASGCRMDTLLLSGSAINHYRIIPPAHGKLKFLHDMVFGEHGDRRTHLLLWVPASHPYYRTGGLFGNEEVRRFSKLILFSSWEMVPRMISVMMSYYAEQYTLGTLKRQQPGLRYITQKKGRYGEGRLRNDSLLDYPCTTLARMYSPEAYYGWKLSDIRKDIRRKVREALEANARTRELPHRTRSHAGHILCIMQILDGIEPEHATDLYIPANAMDVMTDIAIASPAVCAYRLSHDPEDARMVGKAMTALFNKAESAAIIDLMYSKNSDEDYYESVLDYCAAGNLQAVLDEYAHTLQTDRPGTGMAEAILDTSSLGVDTRDSIDDDHRRVMMRCHFAIPFIDKTVTDQAVLRTTNIRKAFNSPFRPFILSTTSIGQEGLDFHLYARKIVHWNLPSNPVDLEQREGRINRFKCLAIRRNVAALFASDNYLSWDEMFDIAQSRLKGNNSDLVPHWCLPIHLLSDEQRRHLQYIERIVPLYPLSRDRYRYEHLIRVLSRYRMTLGQPRQEELLQLLQGMNLSEEQMQQLTFDLCPFHKERS